MQYSGISGASSNSPRPNTWVLLGCTKVILLNVITLKCLNIGTPKIINFPFVSNGKSMFFRCPNNQAHCNEAVLCLNFWDT